MSRRTLLITTTLTLGIACGSCGSVPDHKQPESSLIGDNPAKQVSQQPGKSELTQEEIQLLIQALGSDSWREREEAQNKLVKAGIAAMPALEEATRNKDPEIAARVEAALEKIRFFARMETLLSQLKSREQPKCEKAFMQLMKMGPEVVRRVTNILQVPSDNKVEITSTTARRAKVKDKEFIEYTITTKNVGEKPVWIPVADWHKQWSYRQFGRNTAWGGGSITRSGLGAIFPFYYLVPNQSGQLRVYRSLKNAEYGKYTATVYFRKTTAVYESYEISEIFIEFNHFTRTESYTAEYYWLPEIVEGAEGKETKKLAASLSLDKTEITEGEKLSLKFTIRNKGEEKAIISSDIGGNSWYILLPVNRPGKLAAEGRLREKRAKVQEGRGIAPGKAVECEVEIKPDITHGDYYLICGHFKSYADKENMFLGELVSNAVKITVKPAQKKEEGK